MHMPCMYMILCLYLDSRAKHAFHTQSPGIRDPQNTLWMTCPQILSISWAQWQGSLLGTWEPKPEGRNRYNLPQICPCQSLSYQGAQKPKSGRGTDGWVGCKWKLQFLGNHHLFYTNKFPWFAKVIPTMDCIWLYQNLKRKQVAIEASWNWNQATLPTVSFSPPVIQAFSTIIFSSEDTSPEASNFPVDQADASAMWLDR